MKIKLDDVSACPSAIMAFICLIELTFGNASKREQLWKN